MSGVNVKLLSDIEEYRLMSSETIPTAVTAYFNALETMNPENWIENFSEDALVYDPVGNPPNKARENYQQFFGLLTMAFAKLEISQDFDPTIGSEIQKTRPCVIISPD
jgi:hypothetical protein